MNKPLCIAGLLIAVFVGVSADGNAQSLLAPEGLGVGDQYRVVFITEGQLGPLSSDISVYNSSVNTEAN